MSSARKSKTVSMSSWGNDVPLSLAVHQEFVTIIDELSQISGGIDGVKSLEAGNLIRSSGRGTRELEPSAC